MGKPGDGDGTEDKDTELGTMPALRVWNDGDTQNSSPEKNRP